MSRAATYILDFVVNNGPFLLEEILSSTDEIDRHYLQWAVQKLAADGRLARVGRGRYALHTKQIFQYMPPAEIIDLHSRLSSAYPQATFCIYGGDILVPIQHHLSYNALTYIETDKSLTETVFHLLRDEGHPVFHKPGKDVFYDYVELGSSALIVKPLISGSPLQISNGVAVPTLEKMLVDIRRDPDFDYMSGEESSRMLQIANELFSINRSRLLRYAGRRGVREEISEELNTLSI